MGGCGRREARPSCRASLVLLQVGLCVLLGGARTARAVQVLGNGFSSRGTSPNKGTPLEGLGVTNGLTLRKLAWDRSQCVTCPYGCKHCKCTCQSCACFACQDGYVLHKKQCLQLIALVGNGTSGSGTTSSHMIVRSSSGARVTSSSARPRRFGSWMIFGRTGHQGSGHGG